SATVEGCARKSRGVGSPGETADCRKGLLAKLADVAYHTTLRYGARKSIQEARKRLDRDFRGAIGEMFQSFRRVQAGDGLAPLLSKSEAVMRTSLALVLGFCVGLTGCSRAPSEAPAPAPIPVTVSSPVERDVTDYADFTGRTAAVDSVEVRARVWGYLDKVNFKEGALVKKDDVLFEIDPRLYRADLERARGTVAQYDARVRRLE